MRSAKYLLLLLLTGCALPYQAFTTYDYSTREYVITYTNNETRPGAYGASILGYDLVADDERCTYMDEQLNFITDEEFGQLNAIKIGETGTAYRGRASCDLGVLQPDEGFRLRVKGVAIQCTIFRQQPYRNYACEPEAN
jgi:hypothetical protein